MTARFFGRVLARRLAPVVVCIAATVLIGSLVVAQETTQSVPPPARVDAANLLLTGDEPYRIGAGDLIEIQVDKAPEMSGTFQVGPNGTVKLYRVGLVAAGQKTADEVAGFIADQLRGKYLVDPLVTVTVRGYNSRAIFIQGAVRSPGVYQIAGHPSLLKLITLAGGLDKDHGATAFIIRAIGNRSGDTRGQIQPAIQPSAAVDPPAKTDEKPVSSDDRGDDTAQYEILKLNINGLFKGDFSQDASIEPGDIINIPPTDIFFVSGEVHKPGSFPLKEGTTLRQAISLAEGTRFSAASGRGIIFRDDPLTGRRLEIRVDIGAIVKGERQDIPLMPNDIITVPNSSFKSAATVIIQGVRGFIPMPGRY